MAFVARRSSDGKVVDRKQVLGGVGSRALPLSDISDEESESVMGYTNRTYGAPTVRFMGQGEGDGDNDDAEDDAEGELEDDNLEMEALDNDADASGSDDSDSILNFCNQLDEEEANEAKHKLTFEEQLDVLQDSVEEFDELSNLHDDDKTMMGKPEDAAATDTETVINFDQDLESLCSLESFTPTMTQREEDIKELDNISVKTFLKEDSQDNMSGKSFTTHDKQDNLRASPYLKKDKQASLSARTFLKQASIPTQERQREADLDLGQLSNRTYDLSNCSSLRGSTRGSQRTRDNSSMSTCSWTDMYRGALEPSDGRSGIVPSLSLASVSSDTSTFYKNLEENKERHSQAAFEDWKARKEEQKQKSILAAKQAREKREAEAALRQQQSQAHFQEWCRRKEQQQQQRKMPVNMSQSSSGNSSGSISSSGSLAGRFSGPGAARKAASDATKKRLKEWQLTKTEQQQREREQKRRLEENKQKLEEERKQRSQGAWKNWMKQVDKRAKPVPLNQGFDTLRGTISNIYINPIQWVSNIDPKESGRSR